MIKLRVLISAYACEPGRGSEPGVGWNLVTELAKEHEIWVVTRTNNRAVIEKESSHPDLHFAYYDLPDWLKAVKKWPMGLELYYYLWQVGAARLYREISSRVDFDLVHHLTFVRYWRPSLLPALHKPFVWGPVGGGESAPLRFWSGFGLRGMVNETIRVLARKLGEWDPVVRWTARNAAVAIATTSETAARMSKMGSPRVLVVSQVGQKPVQEAQSLPGKPEGELRLLVISSLLYWKGIHLAIRGFSRAGIRYSKLTIVGVGPDKKRLQNLAIRLRISDQVTFAGKMELGEVYKRINESHALLHTSLHDSGAFVCAEAMVRGKPVICLNIGGPGIQVTPDCGFPIEPDSPEQVVREVATAIRTLATDPDRRNALGQNARARIKAEFTWTGKAKIFSEVYRNLLSTR